MHCTLMQHNQDLQQQKKKCLTLEKRVFKIASKYLEIMVPFYETHL